MLSFLAQLTESNWVGPMIAQFGVGGAMLYWLTRFVDGRLKTMEEAVRSAPTTFQAEFNRHSAAMQQTMNSLEKSFDRMARAAVLQILDNKLTTSTPTGIFVQKQAQEILTELDEKKPRN